MSTYMAPSEASQYLGVSKQRISQLAKNQKWQFIRMGRRIGYDENYVIFSRLLSRPQAHPTGKSAPFNKLKALAEAAGYSVCRKNGGVELSKVVQTTITRHYSKAADASQALIKGFPLPEHSYRLRKRLPPATD